MGEELEDGRARPPWARLRQLLLLFGHDEQAHNAGARLHVGQADDLKVRRPMPFGAAALRGFSAAASGPRCRLVMK